MYERSKLLGKYTYTYPLILDPTFRKGCRRTSFALLGAHLLGTLSNLEVAAPDQEDESNQAIRRCSSLGSAIQPFQSPL